MAVKVKSPSEKRKETAIEALNLVLDSKFLTALAEPSRIEVLKQVIRHGKADISELSEGLSLDRSVISRHLLTLQEAGILVRDKQGKHVYYQLEPNQAIQKFKAILNHLEEMVAICCPPSN
ncbi:transcriptional regulator [Leptospira biflexa]|jgi:DNA-binding transcriptional ArsR family regulator|uniref:Putative transcriptional regulator, ArsR family n=1 Tax=Leptospira biflexa serovar Patoc (strain Patoc 1 / ATCC 23582 / Paris) TaxID=456481 RepID=B0SNS3_LEPBP|nr:metalloregulator ArsR/SmtB family transcription factor [Leptospira biflexa]ABZ93714.1 Transcriptional regulator, ArsR family [Leptospira biflexa serovar Patoc strain 'Patoc 1 (Ames)']ABZ97354.1 Putative transcriptional regulator, ArsR family [Leptospira biflexa serovar Patoc strain 'Patoc 1 (Paris)']TGM34045.1 transcriptional regulator [Leptospira biflexa]TGM40296.1 transcriptional regulator [Leptospira biflexa]TGM48105.1 transcriptional regulator [Leptospira biflexa]